MFSEHQLHFCTLARLTFQFYLCIMKDCSMFYNRKSKACSTGRTGMAFINPVKTFKNSLLFIFRNTNSIIFYAIKRMSINRSRKKYLLYHSDSYNESHYQQYYTASHRSHAVLPVPLPNFPQVIHFIFFFEAALSRCKTMSSASSYRSTGSNGRSLLFSSSLES